MIRIALCSAFLALGATFLPAQQNVGIYISRGISTISGVLCGFDCNDPNNTGTATAQVNDRLDFRLIGDAGMPAVLAASVGTATACPGIQLNGINNSLLLDPTRLIVSVAFSPAVSPGGRTTCNPTGGLELIVAGFVVPPAGQGLTVTFQGLVTDAGTFTFTRAIELTIP